MTITQFFDSLVGRGLSAKRDVSLIAEGALAGRPTWRLVGLLAWEGARGHDLALKLQPTKKTLHFREQERSSGAEHAPFEAAPR